MILGCGVDLVEVDRIEREIIRRGGDLFNDVCTPAEQAWCRARRRPAEGYALEFAAKEACVKALGTGLVGRMSWKDMEISWPEDGARRPGVLLMGETGAAAAALGVERVHLTLALMRPGRISKTATIGPVEIAGTEIRPGRISQGAKAAAWVVLERRDPDGR